MKWFKTSFSVCGQNLRKWRGDYKIYVVFLFMFFVCDICNTQFVNLSEMLEHNEIPIWNTVFIISANGVSRALLFSLLVMLFSNAPFIDDNQLFIVSRCSRKKWCLGQIFYIIIASGAFVIAFALISALTHINNIDFTPEWGRLLIVAAKGQTAEAAFCQVNQDIIDYFTPPIAMFYTLLLTWLSCIFIGLVIYVVNSATQKLAFGILAGGFFVVWDFFSRSFSFVYNEEKGKIMEYISPVSWCSLESLDYTGEHLHPSITFVLCAYALLIAGLSAAAVLISKKQEIKVIQAV